MRSAVLLPLCLPFLLANAAVAVKSTTTITRTVKTTTVSTKTTGACSPTTVTSISTETDVSTVTSVSTETSVSTTTETDTETDTVTATSTTTVAPTPAYTANPLGCFEDCTDGTCNDSGRVLSGGLMYSSDSLTQEQCLSFCSAPGYAYAGVEDGHQCFCAQQMNSDYE